MNKIKIINISRIFWQVQRDEIEKIMSKLIIRKTNSKP